MAANKYGNAANAIYPGDTLTVWSAEAAVSGDRSQCIALGRVYGFPEPTTVALEIKFSGAPGTLQIDMQDADTDTDNAYQNIATGQITAVDANNYARVEFQVRAQFVRVKATTITNAVNLTAKVTA